MKKVKKKWLLCTVVMCMCLYTGCQKQNAVQEDVQDTAVTNVEDDKEKEQEASFKAVTKVIEGYQMADGSEVPVKVTLELKNVQKGEEAYKRLSGENASIEKPEEDMEYVIATFKVSYEEGEIDEIYMEENRGSLMSAGLYFALSNGESNAEDVTSYLADNIYNLVLAKGKSEQGSVAFLHKKDSIEPLYFVGFNNTTDFDIN